MNPRARTLLATWLLALSAGMALSAEQPPAEPPKLDLYGDPLPKGAVARLGTLRFRIGDDVTGLQFSPDGKRLLVSSDDDEVLLLDAATGAPLLALEGVYESRALAATAVFSPNGKLLATAIQDGRIVVADVETGTPLRLLAWYSDGADIQALAFSADGAWLASAGDEGTLSVWDAARGVQVAQWYQEGMDWSALAFSPDGRVLAAGGDLGRIVRFELVPQETDGVRCLAGQGESVSGLTWSADGKRLAFVQEKTLRVCDPVSGRELCSFVGQEDLQNVAVALAPDGKTAVVATGNDKLLFVDVEAGKLLAEMELQGSCDRLVYSPDGQWLAITYTGEALELWDAAQRKVSRKLEGCKGTPAFLSFTGDGKQVQAGTDEGVFAWDVKDGVLKQSSQPGDGEPSWEHLALSADGAQLAVMDDEEKLSVRKAGNGEVLHRLEQVQESTVWLTFSPDGAVVVSADNDAVLRIWEPTQGQAVRSIRLAADSVNSLAFAPDGTALAAATDTGLFLISRVPGVALKEIHTPGHTAGPLDAQWTSDGKRILTLGEDQTVRQWDAVSGKQLLESPNHDAGSVRIAGETEAIVTLSQEGTLLECQFLGKDLVGVQIPKSSIMGILSNGKTAVLTRQGGFAFYQLPSCKLLRETPTISFGCPPHLFSEDGRIFAHGSPFAGAYFKSTVTGRECGVIKDLDLEHAQPMAREGFFLLKKRDVSGHVLVEVDTLRPLEGLESMKSGVFAPSPDGRSVAIADGTVIEVRDFVSNTVLKTISAATHGVRALAISPDGRKLLSVHQDATALVWDLDGSVTRPELIKLGPAVLEKLWTEMGRPDPNHAYPAAWKISAGGAEAVAFLCAKVLEKVNAADEIAKLIVELDNDDSDVRDKATQALQARCHSAEAELRAELARTKSQEVKQRVQLTLAELQFPILRDQEILRRLRAVYALRRAGGEAARKVLEQIALESPIERVKDAAQQALRRMGP